MLKDLTFKSSRKSSRTSTRSKRILCDNNVRRLRSSRSPKKSVVTEKPTQPPCEIFSKSQPDPDLSKFIEGNSSYLICRSFLTPSHELMAQELSYSDLLVLFPQHLQSKLSPKIHDKPHLSIFPLSHFCLPGDVFLLFSKSSLFDSIRFFQVSSRKVLCKYIGQDFLSPLNIFQSFGIPQLNILCGIEPNTTINYYFIIQIDSIIFDRPFFSGRILFKFDLMKTKSYVLLLHEGKSLLNNEKDSLLNEYNNSLNSKLIEYNEEFFDMDSD
ncbi:hypothetical protein RCL1_003151 [Eukaryota sp. TZLM3-RCL]